MSADPGQVRLEDLVEHADRLDARVPLTAAQAEFARRGRRFLGVTDGARYVGLASGRQVGQVLSAQFGHALFGRTPVADHVMPHALVVTADTPLTELLKLTAARSDADFYSDIALVSPDRAFLGLIPVHRLVRLQTSLLLENLAEIEAKRRELLARNRQMEDDLRMAREVQLALMPAGALRVDHSSSVCVAQPFYQPADLIGGDFYAVFQPSPSSLGVLVCDVMGHGVRPALITAILCALLEDTYGTATDPAKLLNHLDRGLRAVLRSVDDVIFVTAACSVIDLARSDLHYAHAGHPPALRWSAARRTAAPLELVGTANGPALGLVDDAEYASISAPFDNGDALLLYTDGVLEVADPSGQEFGGGRMGDAFADAMGREVADPARFVCDAARKFGGANGFTDDVCLLLVQRFAP